MSTDIYTLKKIKKCTKIVRNISEKEVAGTCASHLDNLESVGDTGFHIGLLL